MTLQTVLPNECTLDVRTKSGTAKQLTINRPALKFTPRIQKTESRWLEPDKIAYMKVPSFNSPEFEKDALEQLMGYKHAQAIIVDVRGNGGGSTPSRFTQALMNKQYRWWTEGTPLTVGLFRHYAQARPDIELNEYFRNAQLTWQSAEIQPDFGDGISIGIGTKRAFMPNGSEFEGIGIVPDIAVPVQREDLYSGKDRALERAMAEVNRLINPR